jgi:signal transduction histidine kinase
MPLPPFAVQLREWCRLTGAVWAVELQRILPQAAHNGSLETEAGAGEGSWVILARQGLLRSELKLLSISLDQPAVKGWLAQVSQSGRSRSRRWGRRGAQASFLHAFPTGIPAPSGRLPPDPDDPPIRGLLLICAEHLDPQAKKIWRLAALTAGRLRRESSLEQELENARQELQARIAAQTAAEQRLIQAAKLAAVGEMAAGVAHELNNPLTAIVGFSEMILDDLPQGSPNRADLETVLREAQRARDVVRRLLDFSRRSEMVRASVDINEIVRDTLGLVRHLLNTGGVRVRTSLRDGLPWAFVDRDQMKQVLLNLLHNALAALPEGGVIEISTTERQKYANQWITLAVQDSGVGIPSENMQRIFEPFFTTRAREGGTGLGLAVTYGIVSGHGGMIEVESAPGAGAVFTVWLPVGEPRP